MHRASQRSLVDWLTKPRATSPREIQRFIATYISTTESSVSPTIKPKLTISVQILTRPIAALNAARGNLKTQIHKEIYRTRGFLTAGCSCHKDGLFAYELALDKTDVWPLEEKLTGRGQSSVQEVLAGLRTFTYIAPNDKCHTLCSRDYDKEVAGSVIKVQVYFEGLCLDCLDDEQQVTI